MSLPKDPVILLSYVNTQLRDNYNSLDDFCHAQNADEESLRNKLKTIDYTYDASQNQFI
ncbi:MAG: DUF4250 domain-containing protein [Lachnospiraceae bacterium]|nr:DUF4250 domain-containing protein [Lachnospiraceae bacterium]